jgi:nucleotide-binding universal stress UspA family protein
VVGSDRRSVPVRLLSGNVTTGVAARSPAPVVSVPETWSADLPQGVVVVGVKHPEHAELLMTEAFELARERGSRLVVLHAWQPRHATLRFEPHRSEPVDVQTEALEELHALLAPWRERFPEVEVELRTVEDEPTRW